MSANKENAKAIERRKSTMTGSKEDSSERNPLKTLSLHSNADNCLAGPSRGFSRQLDTRYVTYRTHREGYDQSQGSSIPLDTRYVTYRARCEELDYSFMVFKDDVKQPDRHGNKDKSKNNENKTESERSRKYELSNEKEQINKVKKIEKEPSYREKNTEDYQSDREKRTSIQVNTDKITEKNQPYKEKKTDNDQVNKDIKTDTEEAVNTEITKSRDVIKNTPFVVYNTPNVGIYPTKKVKRSLKRPLARLLATTSPLSAKSYQFTIYSSNDVKVPIPSAGKCFDPLNQVYMLDNLNHLLQTEKKVLEEPRIRKASRSCVINWIINVNGTGGNPAVVQLASWYFDGYLSTVSVTIDRLQVIAAACFWIATKFHGRIISARRLVKYSGHAFIERELVDAERNILKNPKFQALPVTPHDFVPYLAWCCDDTSGLVESAAVFLCQCGVLIDKNLSVEYPSVVAAAAVKSALILLRMESSIHKLAACPIYSATLEKAMNLNATCAQLRNAVRMVASVGYEYKAPLFKFSGPPHYISTNIVRAVSQKEIVLMDIETESRLSF